jgi:nucleotide-binding universal stress UspA family protein
VQTGSAMHRKIVIGHDLHGGGDDALALGHLIADATGAELVVAGIFPFGRLPRGFERAWDDDEADTAARLERIAREAGAEAEAYPSSSPATGLSDLAEEIGADLVVVGSSRHGKVGQILAGNVGVGLLAGSATAVAIAPRGYAKLTRAPLRRLTLGYDGSEESRVALMEAVEIAQAAEAELKLVAVAEDPPVAAGLRAKLAEAFEAVPRGVAVEASLVSGDPAEALADASRGSSLLILGSRELGPIRRVTTGSVSSELASRAPCPLLIHPRAVAGAEVQPPAPGLGSTA